MTSEELSVAQVEERISAVQPTVAAIREEVGRVLVGQRPMVDGLLVSLLCHGHVLLEGVPGLAKTTAVAALTQAMHLDFQRIQFTPDLLPADLVGTQIYNPADGGFRTHKGPVFANIVLADEINRAPAKVQSALLEAMQERQVTLADRTWKLPEPFLVLATQNPIEQEGTYTLPEAQADRFLLKIVVRYPTRDEEREILRRASLPRPQVRQVADAQAIIAAQQVVRLVRMEQVVADYIVDLVHATRDPARLPGGADVGRYIEFGASPRATLALASTARAHAFLDGRGFVTPDDVKAMAPDVLRHRVLLTYEAEAEGLAADQVIEQVLQRVRTP
ncbi:MAG: MoxR family ATPase [Alphaproteobacteria bacterium]|nr:MoxR family ATPase [Alphaproteobacteria bacterium]